MVSRNHITDHGFACAFCVSCAGLFYRKRLYKIMTSLVVPGLDTLRQWLDDLGMSFF
ncbi:putative sensory transduction regulator [Escherichia coli ISC7]|uniref:Sensory transduction regulator n=1 Tax=Escherichia coli ISC7 TaxID=1432555 RepID=W1EUA6_ECOLX|nr:putative sensory transduction regulator [Escherichia coli ISC7]